MSRLLPKIVRLSPTALTTFTYCPRRYLNKQLLGTVESDVGSPNDHGLRMHELLRFVHTHGSCHDESFLATTLRDHGSLDDAVQSSFAKHRERCPQTFDAQRHEIERARYHHQPIPQFLATARVDAIWIHDGIFDLRDYKTGTRQVQELRDDVAAQVQAWVWAPRAQQRGLRLQIRYEYLSTEVEEDPDTWEPDEQDIDAIEEQLRSQVEAIRRSEFQGVADPALCKPCPYRSLCPHSAAPGAVSWPAAALVEQSS